MTLRRKFQTYIIPSIEKEIQMEKDNLKTLQELSKTIPSASVFIPASQKKIQDLTEKATGFKKYCSPLLN